LTDARKLLITIDDFCTVKTQQGGIKNWLGCSIAGIWNVDVETLQSRLGHMGVETYDPNEGANFNFLESCRGKNILCSK